MSVNEEIVLERDGMQPGAAKNSDGEASSRGVQDGQQYAEGILQRLLGRMIGKQKSPENERKPETTKSDSEFKAFKVNPFVNAFMRITGEWPLTGPIPVSENRYKKLFAAAPSFIDFFPVVDYSDEDEVYLFDDGINVAGFYKVGAKYMMARSPAALEAFNDAITQALNALPSDDYAEPYVVQIYAQSAGGSSIGDDLARAMAANGLSEDPYSQEVLRIMREHEEILTHEKGVFPDSRINETKGWRVGREDVYLCIYSNRTEKFWKKNKRSPAAQLKHDLNAFFTVMRASGITLEPLKPHELVSWLAPFFGGEKIDEERMTACRQTAAFDIGQKIFPKQPDYHFTEDARERGIWRFGDNYLRYLSIGGIETPPRDGEMTLGQSELRSKGGDAEAQSQGNGVQVKAALFEQLPTGAMVTYTIIPQPDYLMKNEINAVLLKSHDGGSREAVYATEQAQEVHEEMLRNRQRVFYAQMGIYLKSPSLQEILDDTEQTVAKVKSSGCIEVIEPRYDLISQDSFIRNLPCVYDFSFDRKAAKRARKCYTAHLASLLPFYGNKSGSKNPCYVMYSRNGEPFYLNPYHSEDRAKVSHEMLFGPSGAGKSATVVYKAMMSMAVNNPRMFIFDYGNSFGLLANFMARFGKKVKRIELNPHSTEVFAPFFETGKALAEAEMAELISRGEYIPPEKSQNDPSEDLEDEKRSYLHEMEIILSIMINGEKATEPDQVQRGYIAEALVRGLRLSREEGEAHARPDHMYRVMEQMAHEEAVKEGGLEQIALDLRRMAAALKGWTMGLRGMLFNRISQGLDESYDLTVIELGALGKEGTGDMLAVAGLAALNTITALAEKLQNSGRAIEVKIDEMHLWAKVPMLMSGTVVAAKVFRKLRTWLFTITQDVSDFKDEATKILSNSEFSWLLQMGEKEIQELNTVINLSSETKHLLTYPRKEEKRFVEGVSLSAKFPPTLVRWVPPAIALALGQTDGSEKENRYKLMREHELRSELDAALMVADDITRARRAYQEAA